MSDKNIENSCENQQKTKKTAAESGSEESGDSDAHNESSAESGTESSGSGASRCSGAAAECPICLRSLTTQNIGFPEDCASTMHIFCALCIVEWSRNVTTCPIDRKEFSGICIMESWSNRTMVRSVKVERKEFNEDELLVAIEEDLTYCEICQQGNREHMMLLCDDCDKGFHMDCLTPVLREIPAGSWFCPRCDPESVAESSESEMDAPRIIRTRQTERIRAAILIRNRISSPEPEPQPGPSSRAATTTTTLERVRRRLTARRTRRRRRRRVRTTVEEYDINSNDEKFPIRRKCRVKRRRKITRKRKNTRRDRCTENNEMTSNDIRSAVPTLRLFEPANSLEYFSDEEVEEAPVEHIANGDVMTIIRNVRPIGGHRTLLKRKVAISAPAPVNILDMIMQSQEKLHSKGDASLKNGKSVFKRPSPPSAVITNAPLNGIGEQVSVPAGAVNAAANETNSTTNAQSSGGVASGASTGGSTAMSSGGNAGENAGSFRYSYVSLPPMNNTTTTTPKKGTDMFEDEENCPNFSVYSTETMNLAKQSQKSEEKVEQVVETDVDLVQLSGDEETPEDPLPAPPPAVTPSKWKPVSEEVHNKEEQERSRVLKLYDSDGENIEEWNKDDGELPEDGEEVPKVVNADDVPLEEPERSYTPCLDENQPKDTETPLKTSGIDGMETELISEEEDSNLNEHLEPFKRGTKARERNYREKRSRTPQRRSRSAEDKENRKRQPRDHRKELPRYDVRNVIARVGQRDPFGRNKERNQSRSRSPHEDHSRSRSVSRRSFTISRSPSYDHPVFRRGSRRSSSPRRRSGSPRHPAVRRRRSTSRSRSNSKTPKRIRGDLPRRRSKSPGKRRKPKKDKTKRRKQKPKDKRKVRSRSKSSLPPGWSRDASPGTPPIADRSWTPPIAGALPKTAENLRVVVNNRESPTRTKKKEKKKKSGKKKEKRKERSKHRHEKTTETTSRTGVAASKEVFASGENILVSVSFNNVQEKQKTPERRVERDPTKILQLPVPAATKTRRHKKTDAKPVAIIDLDGSPFNEIPPSPVIILSDSDHETNGVQADPNSEVTLDEVIRPASPPESPSVEEQFRAPAGPKTPPEPPQLIKFSVPSKTVRMRQINTIFDTENDVSDDAQSEPQKIGPNTPPEPTPTSPDVYDPFEPTKSPSEHSDGDDRDDGGADDGPPSRSSTPPLEETEANLNKKEAAEKSAAGMNPVDLVMSLINKSTASILHDGSHDTKQANDDDATNVDDSDKQIQVISNVVVTPAKGGSGGVGGQYLHPRTAATAASTTTPHKIPTPTYKPTQKSKAHGTVISKLPLPRKPEAIEIDSPYSPGSSDFDDLFEPPTSTTDTFKPHKQPNVTSSTSNARGGMSAATKIDMFDNLFGSTSPVHNKFSNVTSTYKAKAVKRRKRRSRKIDDDEIPSSAVELQVKDKLLRKLNRQERVIEEVKLVIKPHYNKKRITKEEYKEIMRKAVPKICHSKSGEINPVKIQALVEAYVKKVRYRRKNQSKMQTT